MAAMEIDDYLANGNIKNSVNLPEVNMERTGKARICIIHTNTPGMLTNIMPVLSAENINIENMTNKSKGDYAYSVFDVNSEVKPELIDQLEKITGIIRVRVIR
jgi:Guanosine polyphosphate pyrophosphohydrolases/synthetases